MSEIKTIKGKCDFLCVPLTDKTKSFASDLRSNSDLIEKWFILSAITEENASLLVDCETKSKGRRMGSTQHGSYTKTAKESLFSLLKANDCWIKEWLNMPKYEEYKWLADSFNFIRDMDKYRAMPDDYLLIIKQ